LATALLLAVYEAAPGLEGMKRAFSQAESEATEEAMLVAQGRLWWIWSSEKAWQQAE
jgi:hypothetical protein